MTLVNKKSKTRQAFGLVIGSSLIIGIIGLTIMFLFGFQNNTFYWSSLWNLVGLLYFGIIGARIYAIIWRK